MSRANEPQSIGPKSMSNLYAQRIVNVIQKNGDPRTIGPDTQAMVTAMGGTADISEMPPDLVNLYLLALVIRSVPNLDRQR